MSFHETALQPCPRRLRRWAVAEQLTEAGARGSGYRGPVVARLEGIAELVCQRQETYGFPADRLPPVISGHPQRQLRPHTISGVWSEVEQFQLCIDGFSRLISDYALLSNWRQVVTDGRGYGPAYLEKLIRDVERSPISDSNTRFKRSGDVAAILLSPEVS